MAQVATQISATSQQSAGASEQMRVMATQLEKLVSHFRLRSVCEELQESFV